MHLQAFEEVSSKVQENFPIKGSTQVLINKKIASVQIMEVI